MSSYLQPGGCSTVSSTRRSVAGCWPFPQPLHGLGACALAFEGSRSRCTRWPLVTTSTAFLTFVRFDGHDSYRAALFRHRHGVVDLTIRLLLLALPLERSHWFSKIAPPPYWVSRVHSRSIPPRGRFRPSARSCQPSSSFRPCRSSRLRRFTPHRHPAGMLQPAAGHGVRYVSGLLPRFPRGGRPARDLSR
jgi:hypothetical protein